MNYVKKDKSKRREDLLSHITETKEDNGKFFKMNKSATDLL